MTQPPPVPAPAHAAAAAPALPIVIPLEGATNVRDLGGYATRDGRRVRTGHLFRAASLAGITAADVARLDALGLRTICDLRGVNEAARARAPLSAIPHVTVHSVPIEPTIGASLRAIETTRAATGADVMAMLRRAYISYSRHFHAPYRTILGFAADPATHGLLFHCSAGKDRTGFGAALLLYALGVGWDDILADYMATNRLWVPPAHLYETLPEPLAKVLFSVHEELLPLAFETIRADHGSVDAFLDRCIGLPPAARRHLQSLLLA